MPVRPPCIGVRTFLAEPGADIVSAHSADTTTAHEVTNLG
jgi:hypothetical protein